MRPASLDLMEQLLARCRDPRAGDAAFDLRKLRARSASFDGIELAVEGRCIVVDGNWFRPQGKRVLQTAQALATAIQTGRGLLTGITTVSAACMALTRLKQYLGGQRVDEWGDVRLNDDPPSERLASLIESQVEWERDGTDFYLVLRQ